ncbi:hypothetical protein MSAN_00194800 [Mycena sanguinolenta]|uniref:F-box domain-containing protein n=1 Tax=Mycena sanguinolenta TaxID=230812 RepID=A0A8H6ZEU6_9AGAR|nr:hypothetical protein MSAN_00194800 [Mycena sanguinolenta]
MVFRLPQELVDLVIDFMAEDSLSPLPNCALVCRSWLPRSRSHLFEDCPRLLDSNTIPVFRDLLQSPHCTFRSHIRMLLFSRWEPHDHSTNEILLAAGLHRLKNVRTLHVHVFMPKEIEAMDLNSFRAEFLMAFGNFPAVTSLRFSSHIRNDQRLPLIELVSSFSALKKLTICEMPGFEPYSPSSVMLMPPQRLRCLHLLAEAPGPVLAWLHAAEHLPQVDSITLYNLRSEHIEIVRAALQQVGSALRHLEITLNILFQSTGVDTLALFDLSLHPELEVLNIRDSSSGSSQDFGPEQVLPFMTTLTAPKLEKLVLEVNPWLYGPSDWTEMDALLCSAHFPCLQSVILAPKDYTRVEVHERLRAALPLLDAGGLLQPGVRPW